MIKITISKKDFIYRHATNNVVPVFEKTYTLLDFHPGWIYHIWSLHQGEFIMYDLFPGWIKYSLPLQNVIPLSNRLSKGVNIWCHNILAPRKEVNIQCYIFAPLKKG